MHPSGKPGILHSVKIVLLMAIVTFNVSICVALFAETENTNTAIQKKSATGDTGLLFLPEVSVMLDGASLTQNDLDYTSNTHRAFSFDILRYGRYVFSTYINEEIIYRERGKNIYAPWIVHYDMDYFSLRMEFKYGSLYYFMDHLCNNIINQEDIGLRELRWYGAGLRWETHGFKMAHRNKGLRLKNTASPSILNNFNFMISVVQKLSNGYTECFKYDMFVKGVLRYDLLSFYNMIPYVEGSIWGIIDEDYSRVRYDRTLEGGLRINYNNIDITPYYKYAYKNDAEIYNSTSIDYHSFGLRMETVLMDYSYDEEEDDVPAVFFPEIHFLGQYGKYLTVGSVNVNHRFNVDIDVIRIDDFSIFVNNGLQHDSTGQGGLFPRFMDIFAEGGTSYWCEGPDILAEVFYRYERFDDGNQYRGFLQRRQLAAVRIGSRNMKIGQVNRGINYSSSAAGWLNRFGWQVFGGKTVADLNYPYDWEYGISGRWDIMKYKLIIPYIQLRFRELRGKITDREFSFETGVRLYDKPTVTLFHDYTRRSEADLDNGLDANQFLLGLSVEL